MTIEYKVEWASTIEDLEDFVSKRIAEGYQPIGGVSVAQCPSRYYLNGDMDGYVDFTLCFSFCQAMIRKTS